MVLIYAVAITNSLTEQLANHIQDKYYAEANCHPDANIYLNMLR
ncbi:hypothetical protein L245_34665 [Salmonella enterica subsp. enterica serovar Worthington str. BCH-4719]|nr:hypothetical protein L245_34665 [Salmonella enterica subsp. enterica serovar Worthington str. BCH-4719]